MEVLEFPAVLETIAGYAVGEEGKSRVRRLRPLATREAADTELAAVQQIRDVLAGEEGFELGVIPEAAAVLSRLAVAGAVLDAEAIVACGTLIASSRRAASDLSGQIDDAGLVRTWVDRLWSDRALEDRVARTFDESGEVSDRASPDLRRLRRRMQDRRSGLVDRLDAYSRSLPDRIRVADGSVTVRGGRYCIPVRREGKGTVGGLVHDASGSRQTLFVEPPIAIEPMNEIRELEIAVRREIDRILRDLSEALRTHAVELADSFDALCNLDAARARAAFANTLDCMLPEFVDPHRPVRIRAGRHPLLAVRGSAVPFDLELLSDERVLLVSGPNAGGKTVLLKSVGLIFALARSGVIPPVGPKTKLPFLGGPFAIIGDEQSIEASLSTFGAQARNLAEILDQAGPEDLVLIDEIGSATDPAEGGALAAATLAALAGRVRLTIATTHLGDLKGLAEESEATVNASLQFDSDKLEPTYRLEKNRPGRSYALEIAARLGIPSNVLEDARARLDSDHQTLDALLARLEREQAEVVEVREELDAARHTLALDLEKLRDREEEIERRNRDIEREGVVAVEAALRAAREDVETAIRRLEAEYSMGPGASGLKDVRRATRDVVERGLREAAVRKAGLRDEERSGSTPDLMVGEDVTWGGTGRSGILVELRGDRGVVEIGGVRVTMPVVDLTPAERVGASAERAGTSAERARTRAVRGEERVERRPEFAVTTEIDLRGLRVEEVAARLIPALDAAVVAELPWLRIIHGKGTGALRRVVEDLLDDDPRVTERASGDVREGGTGVTMVRFE